MNRSPRPCRGRSAAAVAGARRRAARSRQFRVLPGFGLTLGYTLFYVSLIVLLPLSTAFVRSAQLGPVQFWQVVTTPRVLASLRLSFGAALLAALINAVFGFIIAWALTRTRFPGAAAVRRDDRSAVRAAHRGGRHRTHRAVRAQRLDRAAARAARHPRRLHPARRRGGAGLRQPAVRRAHAAAGARRAGPRGRARRRDARRLAPADLPVGGAALDLADAADRRRRSASRARSANTAR